MKTLTFFLHLGVFFAGAFASAKGIESSMKGFHLRACSADQKQCLVVTAAQTQGSQAKQLHALSSPQVTITTIKGSKNEILNGDSGYVDIEGNQLVLYKRENGRLKETSLNLSTFEKYTSDVGAAL